MTAGEGEFSGLGRAEALRRMTEARKVVEDAIGRPAAGFIAPAWLYSQGARDALAEAGFAMAEDHLRVWHPPSGRILARGPVITWATRTPLTQGIVPARRRRAAPAARPASRGQAGRPSRRHAPSGDDGKHREEPEDIAPAATRRRIIQN